MTEAIQIHEKHDITYRQATDVAGMCRDIVTQTAVNISGKKYVRVEGWQAIAVAHGCVASARDVERIEGGIRAIGEVRRGRDGLVLAQAEGFVGDDEAMWGKREEYAKRAMAQTRAISRACRSAFAHVVVMMNAGLETTPAEEVPYGGFTDVKPEFAPATKPGPVTEERKPAASPMSAPAHGGGDHTAVLKLGEVKTKTGQSAKGPWCRWYTRSDDGQFYSTFDRKMGELLENLAGETVNMTYTIKTTPKGEQRTVTSVEPEIDGAAEQAQADHNSEVARDLQDDIPF